MTVAVVPLDPRSPQGIATAERINKALGEVYLAICTRRAAARAQRST